MMPGSRFSATTTYRQIETTSTAENEPVPRLQQLRWPPANIAATAEEATARLFMLPGARYRDSELSWTYAVAPAAIGFAGDALGAEFAGNLWIGLSVPEPNGGPLLRVHLDSSRLAIPTSLAGLEDRVVDNTKVHDLTEGEGMLAGQNFGIITDIETGPNSNLFLVSLNKGAIYEISRQ
jgi:hypothetical protein